MFRGTGRALSLSIVDAGMSSLASFLVGLYAVTTLTPDELGIYGVFFAAFVLAGMLHGEGIFTAAEVALLAHPSRSQLAALPTTLRTAAAPALTAAVATMAVTAVIVPHEQPGLVATLALAAGIASVVSPFQDHARRVLHQTAESAVAASVATVQLVSVVALLGLAVATGTEAAALPFGVLATANIVSLGFALRRSRRLGDTEVPAAVRDDLRLRRLVPVGRWLLYGNGADRLAVLAAMALVSRTAGTTAAGYLEAVRVLAQPVVVAAVGAHVALRARSVRAARARDLVAARRWRRVHVGVVAAAAAVYGLAALPEWPGNVLRRLYEPAFASPGLGLAMIAATASSMITLPWLVELVAAGRERAAGHAMAAAAVVLAVAATLAVAVGSGAFAVPLALGLAGPARLLFGRRALAAVYRDERRGGETGVTPGQRTIPTPPAETTVAGQRAPSRHLGRRRPSRHRADRHRRRDVETERLRR